MEQQKINGFITLKLEHEGTHIYVNDERYTSCKFLLINLDSEMMQKYEHSPSMDQITDHYKKEYGEGTPIKITSQEEFWGHCSNFQAWVENDYNCDIMDSRLAFPILKKIANYDPKAMMIFKEEIINKLKSLYLNTIFYLLKENFLDVFSKEELKIIILDIYGFDINNIYSVLTSKMPFELRKYIFTKTGIEVKRYRAFRKQIRYAMDARFIQVPLMFFIKEKY